MITKYLFVMGESGEEVRAKGRRRGYSLIKQILILLNYLVQT